jgi:cysteine desulfurase
MLLPIYLDYASTTPVDKDVALTIYQSMIGCEDFGNPSSTTHSYGWKAQEKIIRARKSVATLIGASAREIIFTSGATESNNLAIQGALLHLLRKDNTVHAITSSVEHKAVLETFKYLESIGLNVTYLDPSESGSVSSSQIKDALTPNTRLVSIMHVNNEIGSISDIASIGALCREHNVLFHVDAAQSAGKLLIDVKSMYVDMLSISGHKMYAPKGIGALFLRRTMKSQIQPITFGGSQERSLRPGTQSTSLIYGLAKASELATTLIHEDKAHAINLKNTLFIELNKHLIPFECNGGNKDKSPFIVNLYIPKVENDGLIMGLQGVAFSTGSACNSKAQSSSHVLSKVAPHHIDTGANIRLSFGRSTTVSDVKSVISTLSIHYHKIISLYAM